MEIACHPAADHTKKWSDVKDYAAIENEVATLIGKINARYGQASWTPIRYVNRSYSRAALSGLYRAADVALVTPLRDGMNLVAKEYVAAQDAGYPGALLLSEFTGAAAELTGALIVNPHESEGVAAALKRALEMPLAERRERHGPMLAHLLVHNVELWAETYLSSLAETQLRPSYMSDLRALFSPPRSRTPERSQTHSDKLEETQALVRLLPTLAAPTDWTYRRVW